MVVHFVLACGEKVMVPTVDHALHGEAQTMLYSSIYMFALKGGLVGQSSKRSFCAECLECTPQAITVHYEFWINATLSLLPFLISLPGAHATVAEGKAKGDLKREHQHSSNRLCGQLSFALGAGFTMV